MVVLYTTGCPRCRVLEMKLEAAGIPYTKVEDEQVMIDRGFLSAPMLEADGAVMTFKEAADWIRQKENENAD